MQPRGSQLDPGSLLGGYRIDQLIGRGGMGMVYRATNVLPEPLAQVFIRRHDDVPCRRWSWRNQLIAMFHGVDARGFRQWREVGRFVRPGERGFAILVPVLQNRPDEESGQPKPVVVGFKSAIVFDVRQTDGRPLPPPDPDLLRWAETLPLIEVAREWGLSVETYSGGLHLPLGSYCRDRIRLGVRNLSTWAHELVHAADDRMGNKVGLGPEWRDEVTAEWGGAVLLKVLRLDAESDLGGCWDYLQHYAGAEKISVLEACGRLLDRTCGAVRLILDTAARLAASKAAAG